LSQLVPFQAPFAGIDSAPTDHIGIDHHEGQSAIPFEGMVGMELEDDLSFVESQSMIP